MRKLPSVKEKSVQSSLLICIITPKGMQILVINILCLYNSEGSGEVFRFFLVCNMVANETKATKTVRLGR